MLKGFLKPVFFAIALLLVPGEVWSLKDMLPKRHLEFMKVATQAIFAFEGDNPYQSQTPEQFLDQHAGSLVVIQPLDKEGYGIVTFVSKKYDPGALPLSDFTSEPWASYYLVKEPRIGLYVYSSSMDFDPLYPPEIMALLTPSHDEVYGGVDQIVEGKKTDLQFQVAYAGLHPRFAQRQTEVLRAEITHRTSSRRDQRAEILKQIRESKVKQHKALVAKAVSFGWVLKAIGGESVLLSGCPSVFSQKSNYVENQ